MPVQVGTAGSQQVAGDQLVDQLVGAGLGEGATRPGPDGRQRAQRGLVLLGESHLRHGGLLPELRRYPGEALRAIGICMTPASSKAGPLGSNPKDAYHSA